MVGLPPRKRGLLFGGVSQRAISVKRGGRVRWKITYELLQVLEQERRGRVVKEMRNTYRKTDYERKEVKTK